MYAPFLYSVAPPQPAFTVLSSPPVPRQQVEKKNLHVDNLVAVHEATLRSLFAPYGRILRVRVVNEEGTGKHAGYGFVMFEREEEARRAMEALDHVMVFSDFPADAAQLHAHSSATASSTEGDDSTKAKASAAQAECKVEVQAETEEAQLSSTLASVRLKEKEQPAFQAPADSVRNADGTYTLSTGLMVDSRGHIGKRLRVSLARQRANDAAHPQQAPQAAMQQPHATANTNLYVAGLAPHYSKQRLDALFSSFGTIVESRILLDRATGNSRGVGFVRFETQDSCQLAIKGWNGRKPADSTQAITVRYAVDRQQAVASSTVHLPPAQQVTSRASSAVFSELVAPHSPLQPLIYNPYDLSHLYLASGSPLSPMPLSQSPLSMSNPLINFEAYPSFLNGLPPLSPLPHSISPPLSPDAFSPPYFIHGNISPSASPVSSPNIRRLHSDVHSPPSAHSSLLPSAYAGYVPSPSNRVTDVTVQPALSTVIVSPITPSVDESQLMHFCSVLGNVLNLFIDRPQACGVVQVAHSSDIERLAQQLSSQALGGQFVRFQIQMH